MKQLLSSVTRAFLPVSDAYPRPKRFGLRPNTGRNACAIAILAIATVATSAIAQTTPATTQATTGPHGDFQTLTISARAVPIPALSIAFHVDFAKQVEGNAAPQYATAAMLITRDADYYNAIDDADDETSDAEFVRRVRALDTPGRTFDTSVPAAIRTAISRTYCNWESPLREDAIRTMLPYLNPMRALANLLRVKFRLALIENDVPAAFELLRASTVLGDHVDDGDPALVSSLVSVGIEAQTLRMLASFVQRPDAPNCYWALRELRLPFGNFARAVECERATWPLQLPALRGLTADHDLTDAQWNDVLAQAIGWSDAVRTKRDMMQPIVSADAARIDAFVASMKPAMQAGPIYPSGNDPTSRAARFAYASFRHVRDDTYKWYALPYPEMFVGIDRVNKQFDALSRSQPDNPFLALSTSLNRVAITNARLDRTIAAMAVVEAIRAYAAAHDGTLPPTLDAIVDTPAPINPVTGKPFDYAVNGDVATIADDGKLVDWPLRYEVRLRR